MLHRNPGLSVEVVSNVSVQPCFLSKQFGFQSFNCRCRAMPAFDYGQIFTVSVARIFIIALCNLEWGEFRPESAAMKGI